MYSSSVQVNTIKMAHYDEYFKMQTGYGKAGYEEISYVDIGSPNQKGHGIGRSLGGFFQRIIPHLKQGTPAVGKETLRSGRNVANDILEIRTGFGS